MQEYIITIRLQNGETVEISHTGDDNSGWDKLVAVADEGKLKYGQSAFYTLHRLEDSKFVLIDIIK